MEGVIKNAKIQKYLKMNKFLKFTNMNFSRIGFNKHFSMSKGMNFSKSNYSLFQISKRSFSDNLSHNNSHFHESNMLEKLSPVEEQTINSYFKHNAMEAKKIAAKIQTELKKNTVVNFKDIINTMEKLPFVTDSLERAFIEENLLAAIRAPNFYKDHLAFPKLDHTHSNFASLFFNAAKMKSLSAFDMQMMQDWYFDMDKPTREFQITDRITIFDAFYFYRRNLGDQIVTSNLGKVHDHLVTNFNEFMTSFFQADLTNFLGRLIFHGDKEISLFAQRVVEKTNYIINPDRSNLLHLSANKKFETLQGYPRILKIFDNNKNKSQLQIFHREKEKMENFLIEYCDKVEEQDVTPEFVLCVISNYLVWTSNSSHVLEAYIPFFMKKLGAFKNEMVLELFFLLLNSDFDKYQNCSAALELTNLIYQVLKNIKINRLEIIEDLKEADYFNSIRKSLVEEFEKWDKKDKAEQFEHPDHYYKKIFREFVKKSVNIYPFAAIQYDEKLFDNLFNNLKKYIKFH